MTQAAKLRGFLLQGRNSDGGWGYHPAKASRLEPTCWALLGCELNSSDARTLRSWPRTQKGLLAERVGGDANYAFHGFAMLALQALGTEHISGSAVLLEAIQQVRGEALPRSPHQVQDNSLRGWSWMAETFSWVEPTAWCMLALKRWRRTGFEVDHDRIAVAERLLIDRCAAGGGWNYGNSNVLGQQLKAYVPTTAIALLALQDRRGLPEVRRSLEFLEEHATEERSGSALALASMALQIYGRDSSAVIRALHEQAPVTITLGNHVAAAMALCALDREWTEHVFRV